VVVVDNASTDATVDEVKRRPWVRLIVNPENRGFAAAANQGIADLDSELALLLNPDAELACPIDPIFRSFSDPKIGAAGGALLSPAGQAQTGFQVRRLPTPASLAFEVLGLNRLFPGNPVNRRYRALDLDPAESAEVEQPAGALLFIRRSAWEALGGFDERYYPAWFEDVDFAARSRAAGWKIGFEPAVAAVHSGGHSFRFISYSDKQLYWYGSLLRYAAAHFSRLGRMAVCGAVMAACFPRALTGVVAARSADPLIVYGRVLRLAVKVWVAGSRAWGAGVGGRDAAGMRRSLL
jgi:GT2 family glycosyltransferase